MDSTRRHRDYTALAITAPPRAGRKLPEPVPARATVRTYGGETAVLDVTVVAVDRERVCIRQEDPAWGVWYAWVGKGDVVRVDPVTQVTNEADSG